MERLAAQLCRTDFNDEESIPMKVMVHTHTTFSGDGELHPQALADLARSRGFDAVLVSDHFESLRPQTFDQLVRICHGITNCLMVPGYERSFRSYHVLALGVEEWINDSDIKSWAHRVRKAGGITAIAHPCRYNHDIPQIFSALVTPSKCGIPNSDTTASLLLIREPTDYWETDDIHFAVRICMVSGTLLRSASRSTRRAVPGRTFWIVCARVSTA